MAHNFFFYLATAGFPPPPPPPDIPICKCKGLTGVVCALVCYMRNHTLALYKQNATKTSQWWYQHFKVIRDPELLAQQPLLVTLLACLYATVVY